MGSSVSARRMNAGNVSDCLIGFDLGTSAVKGVLCDAAGARIAQVSRPITLLRPDHQRVELDAEQYVQMLFELIQELVSHADDPGRIKAVSFSGATGNTVLLDEGFRPVRNAISWLDTRAAGQAAALWPGLDPEWIYQRGGWLFDGTFPLAHLGWLKSFEPQAWAEARHFTMLNDYIYYRLCGRLVVDHSKATAFYLQDQEKREWNTQLLDGLGLKSGQLAALEPSGSVCGVLTDEAAAVSGLAPGTRVVTGSFDHPSAARSTGVLEEGDLLISSGTSWVVFAPVRNRATGLKGRMLMDPFLSPSGCWGAMFALTGVAEKLHAYLEHGITGDGADSLHESFNRLAAEARPGADGLFINLYCQPVEDNMDLIRQADPCNLARALMEGIVFLARSRIDQLQQLTGAQAGRIVLTGGPTNSPVWPSIVADVLNRPVVIPDTGEHAGAMGAVLMAGMGLGIFDNEEDAYAKTRSGERVIQPDPARSRRYEQLYQEYAERFNLLRECRV